MISQPTYDGCLPNFFLPRTESRKTLDAIGEVLNSPEFIKDEIAFLQHVSSVLQKEIDENTEEIDAKNVALAASYAKPEYDRRVAFGDGPKVENYEFLCKVIEPSCEILGEKVGGWRVAWYDAENTLQSHPSTFTRRDAWSMAFCILDRRKQVQP